MEYIGMDVHDRYCQVATKDHATDNPKECRIRAERADFEEFARKDDGAQAAIDATHNYRFVYDCLKPEFDVSVVNLHETGLISDSFNKSDDIYR